jgi:hypothetical protein
LLKEQHTMARIQSHNDFNALLKQLSSRAQDGQGKLTPGVQQTLTSLSQVAVGEKDLKALAKAVDGSPLSAEAKKAIWSMPQFKGASEFRNEDAWPKLMTLDPQAKHVPLGNAGLGTFESGGVAGPVGSPTPDQLKHKHGQMETGGVAGPVGSPTPDQLKHKHGQMETGGVAGPVGSPTPDQLRHKHGQMETGGVAGPVGSPTPDER